jgi:4-amino-4-deoxy-L-arabinose transferase-like glycosyltransferase
MDGAALLAILILILVFIGLPIGIGLLFYFTPKKLGQPKIGKYLTIAYALALLLIASRYYFEERKQNRKIESAILLADREAPLGWVYLRIFKDSSFEFESRGLERRGDIYAGKAKITTDSIFFYYKDSIPKAGNKAVYSDKYVAFTNGTYPEKVEISLSKLISK